jgi:hypothetical protein
MFSKDDLLDTARIKSKSDYDDIVDHFCDSTDSSNSDSRLYLDLLQTDLSMTTETIRSLHLQTTARLTIVQIVIRVPGNYNNTTRNCDIAANLVS